MKHTSKKVIMADEWWFHRPISVWWTTCRNKEKEEVIVFKRNNVFFFVVIKCMKKYCERIIQNGIVRDKIAKLFCTHTIFIKNSLQLLWLAIIFIIICSALEIGKWVDVWLVVCTQVFLLVFYVCSGSVWFSWCCCYSWYLRFYERQSTKPTTLFARSLTQLFWWPTERVRTPTIPSALYKHVEWRSVVWNNGVCACVVLQPPRLCKIRHLLFCTRGIKFDMGQ